MATPLPVNATITFKLPIQNSDIDELGNPVVETEDLIVQCYLSSATTNRQGKEDEDGSTLSRLFVKGRINARILPDGSTTDLPELPSSILPGAKGYCEINRAGGNITGDFFLDASIPSPFGVDDALGGKINGYVVTAIAWGEAL